MAPGSSGQIMTLVQRSSHGFCQALKIAPDM